MEQLITNTIYLDKGSRETKKQEIRAYFNKTYSILYE
jgi:hypothetical protein